MTQKLLFIAILLLYSHLAFSQWLCPWENRASMTLTETAGSSLSNHQVRFDLTFLTGMKTDFSDIRFTNSDGTIELSYWIENYVASTSAIVWVKVPSLPANGNASIYLYYNNPAATDASNGSNTFVFFDHFDTFSGWTDISTGVVQPDNTTLPGTSTLAKVDNCDPRGGYKLMGATLSEFRLITREIRLNEGGSDCGLNRYGVENSAFNGYNINRNADQANGNKPFGYELRTGGNGNSSNTIRMDHPRTFWYRTELKRCSGTSNNITASLFEDDRSLIGSVTGTNTDYNSFDRLTVRGGRPYYIDFMAVAKYTCSDPTYTIGTTEEDLPIANCQNTSIYLNAAGAATLSANTIDNNSTDECGIDDLSLDFTSFSCNDLDSKTVVLKVTDSHNNTATCTATVSINDEINPSITCPSNIEVVASTATCSANVNWLSPTINDNCSIANKSSTHNSGDLFPTGITTVKFTATDQSGNTTNCSFTITVNNTLAPPNISVTDDSGTTDDDGVICDGASATLSVDGSYAAYIWSNSANSQSTNINSSGNYSVTITDVIGCTNSASSSITVHDLPSAGTCNIVHDLCQTNVGQVSVQANGGAAPYEVNWTPEVGTSTTQTITTSGGQITIAEIPGGSTINITVTDSNGCSPN